MWCWKVCAGAAQRRLLASVTPNQVDGEVTLLGAFKAAMLWLLGARSADVSRARLQIYGGRVQLDKSIRAAFPAVVPGAGQAGTLPAWSVSNAGAGRKIAKP